MKHYHISGSFGRHILRIFTFLSLILYSAVELNAERWKTHPAVDNSPVRIVDTERYTFFQMLQKPYSTTLSTYNVPIAAALVYDKENPDRGIFPMKDSFDLHGGAVRIMEYSAEEGFLALLYMDGGLDIVTDAGDVIYNEALKKCSLPGWSVVNSMTVSGSEIWIATSGGYVAVDAKRGETLALANLGEDIRWIARCGEKIIAFTYERFYEASTSRFPRDFSEFRSFWVPTSPGHPCMLMPRKDGSFIYLADLRNAGNHTLNIAIPSEGGWRYRELTSLHVPETSSNGMISNPFDKNFIRNKNGWVFFTTSDLWQLKSDGSPDAEDILTVRHTVRKEDPNVARVLGPTGSWDGTGCWTYLDRGRFSPGELSGNVYLIDDAQSIRPNLPAVSHATHLDYSPEFGTLALNYGYSSNFIAIISNLPPLLSAYKDGEWNLPNPAYCKPRSAEENPELNRLYTNNYNHFPVYNPTGFTLDPINPDYAWLGSTFGGMAALNLRDPKKDPIHLGSPADPLAAYPGFKAILEDVTGWKGYAPLSAPSFDGDGNLWTASHYIDGVKEGDSPARLYYWSKANREKVLASGNVEDISGLGFIKIPCSAQINATVKCLATTHPEGRNLVFMYVTPYPRYLARLNHNGTLENQSDDKIDIIYHIEDQFGARWDIDYCFFMKEDVSTGRIWIGDRGGIISIDPTSEVKDGVIKGEVLDVGYDGTHGNPFSFIDSNGMTIDDSGRFWITTTNAGIWCLSADKKRIEAHYTTSNSLLPHDTAYGIAWNPDTKSLMISTQEGLVELWPDAALNLNGYPLSVSPREIMPDYAGAVFVRRAHPSEKIDIIDIAGVKIANIEADPSGNAVWNLTDSSGERVKTGFYTIKSTSGAADIVVLGDAE